MKRWLLTFSAFLSAGLVLFYISDRRADSRAAQALIIANWEAKAKELRLTLGIKSHGSDLPQPIYDLARSHLEDMPTGASGKELRAAFEEARRDREIIAKNKAQARAKNDIEKQLISSGDYGPKPTQQHTKDYFASLVGKDTIYDFGVVSKGWIRVQSGKRDTLHLGWIQHVGITSKVRNAPWKEYRLFFEGSSPVCEITEEMLSSNKAAYVQ